MKVEVWDVIDEAIKSKNDQQTIEQLITSKTNNNMSGNYRLNLLDASMINVYKNSHVVIFMINPFDIESLQYVKYVYISYHIYYSNYY